MRGASSLLNRTPLMLREWRHLQGQARIERNSWIKSPIEAEAVLVQVGLQALRTNAVGNAIQTNLHI